jgi:endonuclease/exonuclease/phosphatase family metal-dependent hydrolase
MLGTVYKIFAWVLIYGATGAATALSSVHAARKDITSLRLVQYNVEWLFIDYYAPMDCPGAGCPWETVDAAHDHLDAVARVVNELDPDIINMCEVEGIHELSLVIDALDNSRGYAAHLIPGTDTSTGQNVGMISAESPAVDLYRDETTQTYPIAGSTCSYDGSGSTGLSKHYVTEFRLGNMSVAFIAAHLIAMPTDPARCAKREAQASILQNMVYKFTSQKYEVIVMGDFNDFDADIMDINSNVPLSRVLDIIKGRNVDPTSSASDKYTMTNLAEKISQSERYSDWWDEDGNCVVSSNRELSMIDHMLVTPNLMNLVDNVFIYHAYDEYCGKINSDHYPVVVDFRTT